MRKLTGKQQRFIQEYMIDSNATQAALRAGYAANSVNKTGPANLVKIGIKQAIDKLRVKLAEKIGYTVEQAQREYEEARALAMKVNQPAAAATAITGKARLYGMDRDAGGGEKTVIIISPKVAEPKKVESEVIDENGI